MKHFTIKLFLAIFLLSITAFESKSQIFGSNTVLNMNANTATVVDPSLTITATGNITDMNVQISNGYITGGSGDILSYTGSLPSGISASFDNTIGVMKFTGTTTASNWQALLRTVTLATTSSSCFASKRNVTFVLGNKYFNPSNGHYYVETASTNWNTANTAASASTYYGREGYLATSTSFDENSFLFTIIGSNTWLGGSDDYLKINAATGSTTYANQSLSDGNFYWVTGPEKGTHFSTGNAWQGSSAVGGMFRNWSNGEPNDWPGFSTATPGEENFLQLWNNTAQWNDVVGTDNFNGITEFGDMQNDAVINNVAHATRSILINSAPGGIISGDVFLCTGSSTATITLSNFSGSVVRWESSLDQYFTSPSSISNTTQTLNLTGLSQNAFYRAIVNTVTPTCNNLPTSSAMVTINNPSGTWTGITSRDWNTSSNWCGGVPALTTDVIIPAGIPFNPFITSATTATVKNLTIRANAVLTDSGLLQVAGNISLSGGFNAAYGTSTVEFKGTAAQTVPANLTVIQNLNINNSNGVTLAGNMSTGGVLTLTSGILTINSPNQITLGSASSVTGGSNANHVSGRVVKQGTTTFVFPIGKSGKYAPVDISAPASAADFSAEYFKVAYAVLTTSGLNNVSSKEYWIVDRVAGTAGVNLGLYSYDTVFSGIQNSSSTNNLIVAHFNIAGQYWEDLGGSKGISTIPGGKKVTMSVSTFSPFTFGSPNGLNPLPVKLISFNAIGNNVTKTVDVKWETTSEENSKFYEVLHSVDFINWSTIGTVKSNGSSDLNKYTFKHLQPSAVNHYKLKEVDNSGNSEFSDIKIVRFSDMSSGLVIIYPNPSVGSITIANAGDEASFEIMDVTGKVMQTGNFNNTIEIQNLPKGVYIVKIVGEGIIVNEKIIVQ